MEEFSRGRPEEKPSDPGEGGATVRTPSQGGSSSSGSILPPEPPPRRTNPSDPSDLPTVVDYDAELGPDSPTRVDSSPVPGRLLPPIPRTQSSSMLQSGDVLGERYEILQILGEGCQVKQKRALQGCNHAEG